MANSYFKPKHNNGLISLDNIRGISPIETIPGGIVTLSVHYIDNKIITLTYNTIDDATQDFNEILKYLTVVNKEIPNTFLNIEYPNDVYY